MKSADRARQLYRDTFHAEPAAVASAPGRVNLIGEHVDYHGGHVLPMATLWRTGVAVGPGSGFQAISEQSGRDAGPWPAHHRGTWSDYVAGVAMLGVPEGSPWAQGLRIAVASDVPTGAGLSSSAAIEVATAFALDRWAGRRNDARALADLAWRAETGFVGMPCGRMDQSASARTEQGEAMLLDCRTLDAESVPVPCDVLIADSGDSHQLRDSAYAERRREGDEAIALLRRVVPSLEWLTDIPPARLGALAKDLPPPLGKRVRHVVNENQRTMLAAKALAAGDTSTFGALVIASHESLRDLYECSTPRIDDIVRAAGALPGVRGARLVGAGWGGSVLVVCDAGKGTEIAQKLAADGKLALPAVREVRPGEGAKIETD